jgi:hypothetical protein
MSHLSTEAGGAVRTGTTQAFMTPICNIVLVLCWNQLVCMVIVEDRSINYEASTFRTLSSEYSRVLQNTPIFSNLLK